MFSEEDNNKMKRKVRRQVDIELGHEPYKSKIHKNKKAYSRKVKHRSKIDY
jgi:hypothetical protein